MKDLKQKMSNRILALCLAALMICSVIPVHVLAADEGETPVDTTYDYLAVSDLKAEYVATTDSIDVTWKAIEKDVDSIEITVGTAEAAKLDLTTLEEPKYSVSAKDFVGGATKVALKAAYGTNERTTEATVVLPYNLTSVGAVADTTVENNLTIGEIVTKLPKEVELTADGLTETKKVTVTWSTEGISYDINKSEEQTVEVSGTVALPEGVVNRDNVSLTVKANAIVKAATDVSFIVNGIDCNLVEETMDLKVGEGLMLTISASGTEPTYAWYKDGVALTDQTSATLSIPSLALADVGEYYCVVTGKNGSSVTSNKVTAKVEKNDVNLSLSITPEDGQTRPNEIVLEVPVPVKPLLDGAGTITIIEVMENGNDKVLKEVNLAEFSGNKITEVFKAHDDKDVYTFKVVYSGDDVKYNSSEYKVENYSFTKGTQTITSVKGIPEDIKALDEFTITATTEINPESNKVVEYKYDVSDETVASIDKNGKVTTKKQGTFKIIVIAVADDDYNQDVYETDEIKVDYATRDGLAFEKSNVEKTYYPEFNYEGMKYTDTSAGGGDYVYSIISSPSDYILINQDGAVYYSNEVNPFNKDLEGLIGDVVIRLTKKTDGVYEEISAEYTLKITIADQKALTFEKSSIEVTYTADAEGNPLTTGQNIATGGSVKADVEYSSENKEIVEVNPTTGAFKAKKPGTTVVKAKIVGNTFFNPITAEYTITVKKGRVEGFAFKEGTELTTAYGVQIQNIAEGGQSNSSDKVTYDIVSVSDAIKDYAKVDDNGIVYFDGNYAHATDAEEYAITIEATKAGNEYYVACPIPYTLKVTRESVEKEDFNVNENEIKDATLLNSPEGWYNAEHADIKITPDNGYKWISEDGITWETEIVRDSDDKHEISFYLKKESGEVSWKSMQNVNYDKTPATATLTVEEEDDIWTSFLELITFGIWKNENKKVSIVAKDNLSDVMSIEYCEQNKDFKDVSDENPIESIVADLEWTSCELTKDDETKETTATVEVELAELTNKKVVIYAKITDCAGNVSYFRTNGMVFDNITPKQETGLPTPIINIELSEGVEEGLYNGEVPFKLTVNDEQTKAVASGIEDITVTIKGSEAENYEKVIKVTAKHSEISSFNSEEIKEDEFTVDGTFVVPADFDSNYLTINVVVTDYAGNVYNNENPTPLAIDVTNPKITVSYNDTASTFSNGKYIGNNQNRVATIEIEELNFDVVNQENVIITLTQDGKSLDIKPAFIAVDEEENANAVDENGAQILYRMQIDYATLGEGEFDFDIEYTDKATNKNDAVDYGTYQNPQNFIIDNTKPVITVEISNTDVANDKYFKADRTATVTIVERNFSPDYKFDWSGLTLALDGVAQTAPTPVITKSDDNTYVRVYTINFSAEGDYTFDVKYTDLADNLADTYACSSVAYKEFTVDKTIVKPTITLAGANTNNAFKGEMIPSISFTDINYASYELTLTRTKLNEKNADVKSTFIKSVAVNEKGISGTFDTFTDVQDNDGIYTLYVKVTDKAGNTENNQVTYILNRYGSVYAYNNYLIDLIKDGGTYNQTIKEDLVITEYNADKVVGSSIVIEITRDGKPLENVIYTTTPETITNQVEVGASGWYEYIYKISKDNFKDEGVYKIVVSSQDQTGNTPENNNYEDKVITFIVDNDAPEITSITGLEKSVIPETEQEVKYTVFDAMGLKSVTVYVDGKQFGDAIADFCDDINNYSGSFILKEDNNAQKVEIVVEDLSGRKTTTSDETFQEEHDKNSSSYVFNESVTVSSKWYIQWYANKPLFYGTIVGAVVVIAGVTWFIVIASKKKKEEDK